MEAQAVQQYKTFRFNKLFNIRTNKPEKTENLVKPICHNSDGTKATLLSY